MPRQLGSAPTPALPAQAPGAPPEQFDLSDLEAQSPSGCGGKALGFRHISHLGTWGNQSIFSEILQTFRKRLQSGLDAHFGYQDHSMWQERGPTLQLA